MTRRRLWTAILFLLALSISAPAVAQYTPIPDEPSGTGCPSTPSQCSGYKVRNDINARLNGSAPIAPLIEGLTYNPQLLTFSSQRAYQTGDTYVDFNATNGNITYNLPTWVQGLQLVFKRMDATTNTVTVAIATSSGNTIDGQSSVTIPAYGVLEISGSATIGAWDISGSRQQSVNGEINVKDYGATGTGTFGTDDALALQSAVNAGCLVDASSTIASATTVRIPAASYRMTYPLWVNCAGLTLAGAGKRASVLNPTYDFGPTVVFAPQAYPAIPLAAPLVGSVGNSFDFTADRTHTEFLNLREWDGVNGPLGSPSGMNLNGLSAFSVEAYVDDVTAGDGYIVSSNSQPTVSAGNDFTFLLRINGGDWDFYLTTSSGSCEANGGAVTTGATYYLAGTYDGSTCRIYVCTPGATSCAVAGSGSRSGTIVQSATDDVLVGPAPENWPLGGTLGAAINGKIFGPRISNVARYTGTIATVPNTALTADANTLILTNGEQAPGGAPFYKAYDNTPSGGYGYGWLFGYNTNRITAGNYFIDQNGMREIGIRGVIDNTGIIFVDGKDSDFESLHLETMEEGIETFELGYEARNFSDIEIYGAPGRFGINDVGGGLNTWKATKISDMWACEVAGSDVFVGPLCIQGLGSQSRYGLVADNLAGATSETSLFGPIDDAENNSSPYMPFLIVGDGNANTTVNVHGGEPEANDGSPIGVIDSDGALNFFGSTIKSSGGSPTQVVQTTGSPAGSATFNAASYIGFSGAALSSTAGVATAIPCKGNVTLASGSATFSSMCVTTTSVCAGVDLTTHTNSVSFGAAANGSVAVTGTGTDQIEISCN